MTTEGRGARGGKTRLELDSAVFSGAMCRTKLLPHSVFHTREHPQSSGGARGGKARLELDSAVFQAQCAEQSFCRAPYSAQGNIHRAAGVLEGARPASNQIMRFFRRNAPNKAFAALCIPLQGNIHRAAGVPEVQDPPRIKLCGFSGAMRRTKLLPRYVFRTREHPQSSGGARGGKARLELNSAVFSGIRRRKPPRSCWLRGGPAVTGMGDATRT